MKNSNYLPVTASSLWLEVLPLGTFILPLGTFILPLGAFILPLGAFILPLGAFILYFLIIFGAIVWPIEAKISSGTTSSKGGLEVRGLLSRVVDEESGLFRGVLG